MVDVKNKRCICGKAIPYFNEPGQTVPICCSQLFTQTMVNVRDKKCQCGKARPYFNEPGQTVAICCSNETETMVDVKIRGVYVEKLHQITTNPDKQWRFAVLNAKLKLW